MEKDGLLGTDDERVRRLIAPEAETLGLERVAHIGVHEEGLVRARHRAVRNPGVTIPFRLGVAPETGEAVGIDG
jgi:hypothetical protein